MSMAPGDHFRGSHLPRQPPRLPHCKRIDAGRRMLMIVRQAPGLLVHVSTGDLAVTSPLRHSRRLTRAPGSSNQASMYGFLGSIATIQDQSICFPPRIRAE